MYASISGISDDTPVRQGRGSDPTLRELRDEWMPYANKLIQSVLPTYLHETISELDQCERLLQYLNYYRSELRPEFVVATREGLDARLKRLKQHLELYEHALSSQEEHT